ncbi:uncharacterized protein [Malus domestica]|uniref:uncharacterized protein isoform X3 n=1 Tax=Malus domestica TaxID=3750 RepID=UPI003974B047
MTTAIVRTILNYKNYDDWKSQIKTYLLAEDLWDIIDEGTDECPKTEDEEKAQSKAWKKKDAKALYAIQNSCADETYQLIKNKTTAKQAWNTLSKRLEKPGGPSNEKEYISVGEAYQPEVIIEETPGAGHYKTQETFVKYVKSNDWDNAINLLSQDPQLGSAIVKWGGTALHYAIRKRCSVHIIQQLVELMEKEHLVIPAAFGYTALYYLIRWFPERVEVAKCMAEKNPNLRTILPPRDKKALVAIAQANTQGERMAHYFYSLTQPETIKVVDAAHLISHGFRLQRFGICIKPLPPLDKEKRESDEGHLSDQKENQSHHLISSGMGFFRRQVANLRTLLGINRIYQIKLVHELVHQFLYIMCKAVRKEDMSYYQRRKLNETLCVAVERGHVEYITHFCRSTYPVLEVTNEKNQSLLHIAAESRHYNVYNIICEFLRKQDKDDLDRSKYGLFQSEGLKKTVRFKDHLGNNVLHTVARITPIVTN